ncbi:MAG: radical SAM family heme chaperone HemW [Ruminococcaceae bacterium]|nr:radical SAM family heme chaperone HemW [Oscillospiraceae bacterium]
MNTLGLYFHIPFCKHKCPYCDFYSVTDKSLFEPYKNALCEEIASLKRCKDFVGTNIRNRTVDTVYFGGGTPSLWGADNIIAVLQAVKKNFRLACNAEITVECNPSSPDLEAFLLQCAEHGVNRISLGMQSAVDNERKKLGRTADRAKILQAILWARKAGIDNISLDLMIGIPDQTERSLQESLAFLISTGVPHASVYLLSIEDETFFGKNRHKLNLPDEDTAADFYLQTVAFLNRNGLQQYEVSNFAKHGFESHHNSRYWEQKEYLGLGPAAHSFVDGRRFGFSRSIGDFLNALAPEDMGTGGDFEEFLMLKMRLTKGLTYADCKEKFGFGIPPALLQRAQKYEKHKLLTINESGLSFTAEGFLVSNAVLSDLLDSIG